MIQRQCEGAPGTRQALAEYAACCCACGCEFLVWWATVTMSARALYPHTFKKKEKKGKSYSSVALHAPGYCIVWLVATAESCPKSSIQSQIFSLIAPPGFLPPPLPLFPVLSPPSSSSTSLSCILNRKQNQHCYKKMFLCCV